MIKYDYLKIRVVHRKAEICYEQTIKESLTFAACGIDGYSKAANQKTLMETIKQMCAEVKSLGDIDD